MSFSSCHRLALHSILNDLTCKTTVSQLTSSAGRRTGQSTFLIYNGVQSNCLAFQEVFLFVCLRPNASHGIQCTKNSCLPYMFTITHRIAMRSLYSQTLERHWNSLTLQNGKGDCYILLALK